MKQRIVLVITTLVLACGLMLGSMGIAMADESAECRGLFATVDNVTIDENGFGTIGLVNVKCIEGVDTLTLITDNETLYHIPTLTPWQSWADLSADLAASEGFDRTQPVVAGDRIAVSLVEPFTPSEDAVASKVMVIIPGKKMHRHQLGVVAKVEGNTATIVNKDGEQFVVALRNGLDVEPGQFVVMVANRFSNEVQFRAVAAHQVGQLMERFERYMNQASNQGDVDQASGLLEQAHERHMNVLEGMQNKLQDQNQEQLAAAVGQAIDDEQSCYQEAVQLREQIKEQVRESGWDGRQASQSGKN
jgi:hypothetical protein